MPTRLPSHEELGITHELTGLEMAIDSLIRRREGLLARLHELQNGTPAPPVETVPKVMLELPPGNAKRASGWSTDPEERKREMERRMKVSAEKQAAAPTHPRDKNHPGHTAWLRKMKRVQRQRWDNMSEGERQHQITRMARGRS